MASFFGFDDCVNFSLQNCPLFKENKIQLKEKQVQTLKALYDHQECVSVLPTGYGKSVIFHLLPWFAQRKLDKKNPMIAIVVSPLNSIMEDQVRSLRKNGISACCLNIKGTHGVTFSDENVDEENDEVDLTLNLECDVPFEQLQNGEFNLIYSHPEALMKTKFSKLLRSKLYQDLVCAIVIDEVHMISEWGDDFRPAFNKLGELVCVFDTAFHLMLTATATPKSVENLKKQMNLKNPMVITENVDRPNIFLEIRNRLPNIKKMEKFDELIKPVSLELKEKKLTFPVTIMYVENLESMGYFYQYISYELKDDAYDGEQIPENRIFAQYHKDYPESMKHIIIEELVKPEPKIRLVLATVALGMGVNAPSVIRIIHCRPPTTLEKYLQEIGRAGRLGQPSTAILYFNQNDIAKNRKGMTEEVVKYCHVKSCLRLFLVNYFGFNSCVFSGEKSNCCSNCKALL